MRDFPFLLSTKRVASHHLFIPTVRTFGPTDTVVVICGSFCTVCVCVCVCVGVKCREEGCVVSDGAWLVSLS